MTWPASASLRFGTQPGDRRDPLGVTIAWAADHGLVALETDNDEDNLAMQAVNARLGYRALPDLLTMRGSVDAAMMTR